VLHRSTADKYCDRHTFPPRPLLAGRGKTAPKGPGAGESDGLQIAQSEIHPE